MFTCLSSHLSKTVHPCYKVNPVPLKDLQNEILKDPTCCYLSLESICSGMLLKSRPLDNRKYFMLS